MEKTQLMDQKAVVTFASDTAKDGKYSVNFQNLATSASDKQLSQFLKGVNAVAEGDGIVAVTVVENNSFDIDEINA